MAHTGHLGGSAPQPVHVRDSIVHIKELMAARLDAELSCVVSRRWKAIIVMMGLLHEINHGRDSVHHQMLPVRYVLLLGI